MRLKVSWVRELNFQCDTIRNGMWITSGLDQVMKERRNLFIVAISEEDKSMQYSSWTTR